MDVLAAKIDLLEADIKAQELDETDTFVYRRIGGCRQVCSLRLSQSGEQQKSLAAG